MSGTLPEAVSTFRRLPEIPLLTVDREWLYALEASELTPPRVMIAKCQGRLAKRISWVQSQTPVPLRLVALCSAPAGTKRAVHARFRSLRLHGEWFALGDVLQAFLCALPRALPVSEALLRELLR